MLQQPADMGWTAAYALTAVLAVPPKETCLFGVAHLFRIESLGYFDSHAGPSLLWQLSFILARPQLLSL